MWSLGQSPQRPWRSRLCAQQHPSPTHHGSFVPVLGAFMCKDQRHSRGNRRRSWQGVRGRNKCRLPRQSLWRTPLRGPSGTASPLLLRLQHPRSSAPLSPAPWLPPQPLSSPSHLLLLAHDASCFVASAYCHSLWGLSVNGDISLWLLLKLPERMWLGHFWHLVLAGQSSLPGYLAGRWCPHDQCVQGSLGLRG